STTIRSAPRRTSGQAYGWVMANLTATDLPRLGRDDDHRETRDAALVPDQLVPAPPLRRLRAVLPRRDAPPGRAGPPRGGADERPPARGRGRRRPGAGGGRAPRPAALLPRRGPVVAAAAHPPRRGAAQPAGADRRARPVPARRGGGVARGRDVARPAAHDRAAGHPDGPRRVGRLADLLRAARPLDPRRAPGAGPRAGGRGAAAGAVAAPPA